MTELAGAIASSCLVPPLPATPCLLLLLGREAVREAVRAAVGFLAGFVWVGRPLLETRSRMIVFGGCGK